MKQNVLLQFGLLSAAVVAACVTCQAQVYSQGIYSMGTTYFDVCSTALPFGPYQYNITEISWCEDTNGFTITDIERKAMPGDMHRRCLKVVSGSDHFFLPLDSSAARRFADPPIIKSSGDLTPVLARSLKSHGGRTITDTLPVVQASWICEARTNEDVFALEGDHFVQVKSLLKQVCGDPDETIQSSAGAGGNCCSINYSPTKIGVFLNLTRALDDCTIVSVVAASSSKTQK